MKVVVLTRRLTLTHTHWAKCKAPAVEKLPKEEKKDDTDSDDECDPSKRRAALDEFRKRYRFTIPMHHQA